MLYRRAFRSLQRGTAMTEPRVLEIIRQFRENGLKLLLQHPANARDLLALARTNLLRQIDITRMTVDPTTYVASDYRHLTSDLVLRAPLRGRGGRRTVLVYVLIEHQSEPDPLMMLRVLDYLVQIWKGQVRGAGRSGRLPATFRLHPILPVVFYTGTERWDDLGRLADRIDRSELFREVTPDYRPLFVSLPALPASALETSGGYFGWVLELVQQRRARSQEFRALLRRVVEHLELLPAKERQRWLELLSYLQALVYHDREETEHQGLRELIVTSVQTDEHRQEITNMVRSMADVMLEKGRQEGRQEGRREGQQEILLVLLRDHFGKVPKSVEQIIHTTADEAQLTEWIRRASRAKRLDEVGIGGKN
jgi:predicted transposase YdaD